MTELIVALDVDTLAEEEALLEALHGTVRFYKIGMRLFTGAGKRAVDLVLRRDGQVFLDLKLHDIPETVAGAVRQAHRIGARSVSLHAMGGPDMLKAAVEASPRPELWAVTVLTSHAPGGLSFIHPEAAVEPTVTRLARLARERRIEGIICSAQEVSGLKGLLPSGVKFITPGIRPAGSEPHGQRRFVTPGEAARLGIDFIVVGRPVTAAGEPAKAAQDIIRELLHP